MPRGRLVRREEQETCRSAVAAAARTSSQERFACALVLAALGLAMTPIIAAAAAATAAPISPSSIGYDVSFPQCATPLPPLASFAIVGVDGGLANDPNQCLVEQLMWASEAPGLRRPALSGLSLYLNAADPGSAVADWPSPAAGTVGAGTPFGSCDGSWTRACAFTYASQRAGYSYALVVAAAAPSTAQLAPPNASPTPGAASPNAPPIPVAAALAAASPWWIDVEIGASWATRSDSHEWSALNVAALRGYVAGLRAAGARGPIGMYSNASQWRAITGLGSHASRAFFPVAEHDWVTGSATLAQARRACADPFSGSVVTLAQFSEGVYDRDYVCPPARRRSRAGARR